jgi:hypothetical protein
MADGSASGAIVGARCSVRWQKDEEYEGVIREASADGTRLRVLYDDGDEQWEKRGGVTLLTQPLALSAAKKAAGKPRKAAEAQEPAAKKAKPEPKQAKQGEPKQAKPKPVKKAVRNWPKFHLRRPISTHLFIY